MVTVLDAKPKLNLMNIGRIVLHVTANGLGLNGKKQSIAMSVENSQQPVSINLYVALALKKLTINSISYPPDYTSYGFPPHHSIL